jgi:alkaline phosphatase D
MSGQAGDRQDGAGRVGRRAFLAGMAATAAALAGAGTACSRGSDDAAGGSGPTGDGSPETVADLPPLPQSLPAELFALGVASGDPLPDSVVLWTRLVNDPLADGGGVPDQSLPVRWEVAADDGFEDVVASGDAVAEPALAHAVHVDASGLEPDNWYWYRFSVGGTTGPVGRTRTAPARGDDPRRLRFAFASCQDRQAGYWTAYDHLAAEDIDLVVHLGDYIYEGAPDPAALRPAQTPAPTDLAGYRRRLGEYRADPALQAAHARVPWICTWDDHEVRNNYANDVPDQADEAGLPAGRFLERRAAAYQAYYEHMPVRIDPPDGADMRLYRTLAWGGLARFYVLDGRQYRSDQACGAAGDVGLLCPEVEDDDRTMLGRDQEAWLGRRLAESEATWNVLAQQTIVSPVAIPVGSGAAGNLDQWDGYAAARRRLVDQLRTVDNPVVITGDIHASGVGIVNDDPDDPASAPLVPELVGTSISSEVPVDLVAAFEATVAASPAVRYVEARRRGYVLVTVTEDQLRADFRYVSTTAGPQAEVATGATWVVDAGDPVPRPRQA